MRIQQIVQTWRAKNDPNGNPRRVDVVWDTEGRLVEVWEHGYSGPRPMVEGALHIGGVEIPVSEYKMVKNEAKKLGCYVNG